MPFATDRIAIVIPTIGRCDELRKMLQSLAQQTRRPDQVVLVDEAGEGNTLAREFPQLSISVTTFPRGSASAKRNRGMQLVAPEINLIGFMDDDIELEPQALEVTMRFWGNAPEDVGGVSLNVMNNPPDFAPWLKRLKLASWLGLYGTEKGAVLRSGFHVPLRHVSETIYVDWIPTYCVTYRKRLFETYSFDEFFAGYSYLEDLEFSYRIRKKYRLAVVAEARFYHYPSKIGRPDWYLFGKKEVINRLYFVSKHREFSRPQCGFRLLVRAVLTMLQGFVTLDASCFKRVAGNLAGLVLVARDGLRPV
jgi:GT2 family glycosyltransferase